MYLHHNKLQTNLWSYVTPICYPNSHLILVRDTPQCNYACM